jgi:dTDP-glucose 4,6-dehydratase
MKTMLVTGGAGFIGSNFARLALKEFEPRHRVVVLDKLTYAGNLENLAQCRDDSNFEFVHGDICDKQLVHDVLKRFHIDYVINFAAETHVDRSIGSPDDFIMTDVIGTHTLLETSREIGIERYLQVSTDEVYGSIQEGSFTEVSPLNPSSPYSSSKAAGDLLVRSYHVTYGMPVLITRSSNNYGPNQYPEKLIPLFITNAIENKPLPLYGDGLNVRDWIFVEDNCQGIFHVLLNGAPGEIYNLCSKDEKKNIDISHKILEILDKPESLIQPVKDRPGHDRRYSITATKAMALGWKPLTSFDEGLRRTIEWYRDNPEWWMKIKRGEFKEYYMRQYSQKA